MFAELTKNHFGFLDKLTRLILSGDDERHLGLVEAIR